MLSEEKHPDRSSDHINSLINVKDFDGISRFINNLSNVPGRRERQEYLQDYSNKLITTAFEREIPGFFVAGIERYMINNGDIALLCVEKYFKTKDTEWLRIATRLLHCIERKSLRSEFVSTISDRFIDEGITFTNPDLIRQGIAFIDEIDFKKNRSDTIIRVIPKLTEYATENGDLDLLEIISHLLESVREKSVQSALQLKIIHALIAIGIDRHDFGPIDEAFRRAGQTPQKSLKEEAFETIFGQLTDLNQSDLLFDITGFVKKYLDIGEEESRKEYISAYTTTLISKARSKTTIQNDIRALFTIAPDCRDDVINIILKKAQEDPANSILDALISEINATDLQLNDIHVKKLLQLTISERSINSHLIDIYRIIRGKTGVYTNNPSIFHFIEVLNKAGHTEEAYTLLSKIIETDESRRGRVLQTATIILEGSLDAGDLSLLKRYLLPIIKDEQEFLNELIIHSQKAFIKYRSFSNFDERIKVLLELASYHSIPDNAISTLVIELIDSNISIHHHIPTMIELVQQISDGSLQDYSLSLLLVEFVRRGVSEQNRDVLQQAVTLSSMIRGEKTRSDSLVQIIDEVASLAIRDGDLDLLIRLNSWCLELLTDEFLDASSTTIIEAMIRFSANNTSMEALSAAYYITEDMTDQSLRRQLRESIICAYCTLGSVRLESPSLLKTPETLEWALEPFNLASTYLREGIEPQYQAHAITISIDTILDHIQITDPTPYIIPITIILLEDTDPINQRTIILRSATRLRTLSNLIDLNNPYETIALIIEDLPFARRSRTVLGLIRRIIGAVSNQYIRLMKLCRVARDYLEIGNFDITREILGEIRLEIEELNAEEANEILTETAVLYTKIHTLSARECIIEALSRFNELAGESSDHAGRQLVTALVAYNEASGQTTDLLDPRRILEMIKDPIEYVYTTIPILRITQGEDEKRLLIQRAYDKIIDLTIPYDRATILIEFVSSPQITIPWREKEACIRSAIEASEKIKVPFIIFTIKKRIISHLLDEYIAHQEKHIGDMIIELLESINDETVRVSISEELGLMVMLGDSQGYHQAPRTILERCMSEDGKFTDPGQIDRTLQSIPDRGIRSQYYLGIAMLLRRRSQTRRVERLIQQAIREAGVIRPLPRRAYILSDLALTCFINGEYEHAGNIFDMAMTTATNITTAEVRDEVFNELDVAMQLIQEMDESESLRQRA